jgi:antitoxin (DNA-binding transcriptional repressor) of toxin-antitoxin stability system
MKFEVFTVKEWEDNWDELFSRVENGETIGVVNEDGCTAVMVPADDELIRMYTEHDEAP